MFYKNKLYSKKDIYRILNVPEERQGGNWDTGYTSYDGSFYLFVNVGVAGRTGHIHDNSWQNNDLLWMGKKGSNKSQPTIQKMLSGQYQVHVFSRVNSRQPYFTYNGLAVPKRVIDEAPIKVLWSLSEDAIEYIEDEASERSQYVEGSIKPVLVNRYERNAKARKACIEHYGCQCIVCGFNFEKVYGAIGKDFIHVHHIKPLHEIGEEYVIDAIADLRPVCPNCHSMIHKKETAYSIEEMREIISQLPKQLRAITD